MRLVYAGGLLVLAIPAWRKGWRRSVVAAVAIGIAASVGVQILAAMETASAGTGMIELVSLAVRWLSIVALVAMACSRRAEPQVNTGKQI
jgi:hypothetical protein